MYLMDMHEIPENHFADAVYEYCHIALDTCENKHPDWVKSFLEIEAAVIENVYTSPAERERRDKNERNDAGNDASVNEKSCESVDKNPGT
jgi:hypothetical protein